MAATHTSNSSLQQQISHGRRRFLGVRQRPSGRWVAEIKVSSQNLRLWLGTFDSPEDAAMAYDRAARLLRGRTAKTNFPYEQQARYSLFGHTPKLHRLIQHAIIKNRSRVISSTADDQPTRNNNNNHNHNNNGFIDSVVEDTIFCCSSTNRVGSSKVYNSVFVAPSFSSRSEVEGEMVNPCNPLI